MAAKPRKTPVAATPAAAPCQPQSLRRSKGPDQIYSRASQPAAKVATAAKARCPSQVRCPKRSAKPAPAPGRPPSPSLTPPPQDRQEATQAPARAGKRDSFTMPESDFALIDTPHRPPPCAPTALPRRTSCRAPACNCWPRWRLRPLAAALGQAGTRQDRPAQEGPLRPPLPQTRSSP